jgi:hypothetical protein
LIHFELSIEAFSVLRIHSETVLPLALAADVIFLISSALKRTGKIRPFASPFGSFGLPGFLRFFGCSKVSQLLKDCDANGCFW